MSPETYATPERIEQRAQVIKEVLMAQEREIQQDTHEKRQNALPAIRRQLNIEPQIADISDLVDQRIISAEEIYAPEFLNEALPVSEESAQTTRLGRLNVENILRGEDDRLVVIIGPCSIHDIKSALEYADWAREKREEFGDELEIIMRFYPEKPRTVTGWKGLTYDPKLTEFMDPNNPEYDYALGLVITRMLMNRITHTGVPIAMERLNTLTPQYTDALSTYDTIGARNSLDSNSRALISGSSAVGGVKHPPDGSIESGMDSVESAIHPHTMLGNSKTGVNAQIATKGNETSHMILRGGKGIRNFTSAFIGKVKDQITSRNEKLAEKGDDRRLLGAVIVDASHANSEKDHTKQMEVVEDVSRQVGLGETALKGVMVESNIVEGSQSPPKSGNPKDLKYGQSITDKCVGLEDSYRMLTMLAEAVRQRRALCEG